MENEMIEKELVEAIAKSLVSDPTQVEVKVVKGEVSAILELKVGEGDVGKVIGRGGIIAKSIRTIIRAVSVKNGRSVKLEILG
jgi:hypothetical protein